MASGTLNIDRYFQPVLLGSASSNGDVVLSDSEAHYKYLMLMVFNTNSQINTAIVAVNFFPSGYYLTCVLPNGGYGSIKHVTNTKVEAALSGISGLRVYGLK